jgi:hypothetical protein
MICTPPNYLGDQNKKNEIRSASVGKPKGKRPLGRTRL